MNNKFSKIGFILASAGAAVGLANLVIFPARAYNYGSLAFILAYLLFTFLLGVPLMIAETTLGKNGQSDPVTAYGKIGGNAWKYAGLFGIITCGFILSFYNVVAGWSLKYLTLYLFDYNKIASAKEIQDVGGLFGGFITSAKEVVLYSTIFMVVTMLVVANDIKKGIERLNKVFMPMLFCVIILLIAIMPFLNKGLNYGNFHFDFARLFSFDSKGNLGLIEAIGQAFFSLSLGACCMITYGSHINEKEDTISASNSIVHIDTVVALLAGVLIVPLLPVLTKDSAVNADPSLVFITLVNTFNHIEGTLGYILAVGFFVLLNLAIVTSTISLLEPLVNYVNKNFGITRIKSTVIVGFSILAIGVPSILSFNSANSTIFTNFLGYGTLDNSQNHEMGFFNFIFDAFGTFSLLVGTLILCLFITKVWTFDSFFNEIEKGKPDLKATFKTFLKISIKYVVPTLIIALFIAKIYGVLLKYKII